MNRGSRREWLRTLALAGAGFVTPAAAARGWGDAAAETRWNRRRLFQPPREFPAPTLGGEGVRSLFLEGPRFRGRASRIFALYGRPPKRPRDGGSRFPAMVLVHGGGGTAFGDWVRLWTSRGYAAIAMDTCGCVPAGRYGDWQRHDYGGPAGWGGLDQVDWPMADQWMHQAVSAVVLAHSWLRQRPEVDSGRIGITGISWGGVLTCIAAAVDPRFRFAAPVYGCGFFGGDAVNGTLDGIFRGPRPEAVARWLTWWDPRWYLPEARMPFLWVNGTNDFAFPLPAWQQSYRLPRGERTLCLRVRMPHAHGGPGENPQEIQVFADALSFGSAPLPRPRPLPQAAGRLEVAYDADIEVRRAELNFTRSVGRWQARAWETLPGELDSRRRRASAAVPHDATAWYLNLVDARDCVVSTEHDAVL